MTTAPEPTPFDLAVAKAAELKTVAIAAGHRIQSDAHQAALADYSGSHSQVWDRYQAAVDAADKAQATLEAQAEAEYQAALAEAEKLK